MKKIILTGLIFLIFTSLFSQNNESKSKMNTVSQVSISPVIVPSINIGTGNTTIGKSAVKDVFFIFRCFSTFTGDDPLKITGDNSFNMLGLHIKTNYFKNTARQGWFWMTDFGVDYFSMPPFNFDPGGGSFNSDQHNMVLPIISGGGGFSWRVGNDQFLRLSLDIGIKLLPLDLNLAYVF